MRTARVVSVVFGFALMCLTGRALAASAGTPTPSLRRVSPSLRVRALPSPDTVKINVVLTHVDCLAESTWDRFSDSDETLLMVTGFRHPGAQTGNSGYHIFSDVDSGESRGVPANLAKAVPPASGYVVRGAPGGAITAHAASEDLSMVTLSPGEVVGFDVRILEHDDANEADITGTLADITADMAATLHQVPTAVGDILGFLGDVLNGVATVVATLADAILGAGDDYVGGHTVALYRPGSDGAAPGIPSLASGADLINVNDLPEGTTEKFFFIDGGSDGLYMLFYKITKTALRAPAATVVAGVATGQAPSAPSGPLVVQGEAVPQEGGSTVRQVPPASPTSDEFAATLQPKQESGKAVPMPLLGVRAQTISPGDFLGDYQLLVDGVPLRLHLGDVSFWIEDMEGRRYPVSPFYYREGRRCEFSVPVLLGRVGRPATARFTGYLLTHNRAALAGTVVVDGQTYSWYAAKQKGDRLVPPRPSPTPRPAVPTKQ